MKQEKVWYRITKKGRGWVFTSKDFLTICHRNTLDKLMHRLCAKEKIRNIGFGLYDYPIYDEILQQCKNPQLKDVIRALEVQYSEKFQYNGEYACYLLGLIPEKPKNIVLLTNGQAQEINVAKYHIKIDRTKIPTPKKKNDKPTLAIQALLCLGEGRISAKILNKVLGQLNEKEIKRFMKLKNVMPKRMINFLYTQCI